MKNEYELKHFIVEYVNETFYNNATSKETVKFFENLGGKEYCKKAYTRFGRKVVKNISTSPSGELKTIRYFDFSKATEA